VLDVEPYTDVEPEEDSVLQEMFGESERQAALATMEFRTHLTFQNVDQMISWSGGTVASSAASAVLDKTRRNELHHAVHRFAPLAAERAAWYVPECDLDSACHEEDLCSVGAAADICMLERAYLHACIEGETPETATDETSSLAALACPRHELYSFAVSRLRDLSPAEVQHLLEVQSTAVRLRAAEIDLFVTRAWLARKLGLGDLHEEPHLLRSPEIAKVAQTRAQLPWHTRIAKLLGVEQA